MVEQTQLLFHEKLDFKLMSTVKAKQEAIKNAYGEAWEKVKSHVDKNGWVSTEYYKVPHYHETDTEFRARGLYIRPKSLSGIEDNNGWTRSEDQLPTGEGMIHHCIEGKYAGRIDVDDWLSYHSYNGSDFNSHWKPYVEPKPPLY